MRTLKLTRETDPKSHSVWLSPDSSEIWWMVLEFSPPGERCSSLVLFSSGDFSEIAEGKGDSDQRREPSPL